MAQNDPMKPRFADDLVLELERLYEDSSTLVEILDRLRESDHKFRQRMYGGSIMLVDRTESGSEVVTDTIDRLLARAEVQVQRTSTTIKRSRETLKLSGL